MRSRENEAALPELERMLTTSAAAQMEGSRQSLGRRIVGSRGSRIAAIGVTCLAFGGSAMAATGVWNPSIGSQTPYAPAPTISEAPVSTAITDAIGTLRREPTAQDHGPEVEKVLSTLSNTFIEGIKPDSARFLQPAGHGEALVMFVTQASVWTKGEPGYYGTGEPVCVANPSLGGAGSGEASAECFGLGKILAGEAIGGEEVSRDPAGDYPANASAEAWGIVPDGVASISATLGDGSQRTAPVRDNYFGFTWDPAEVGPTFAKGPLQVVWHDADGNVVPQQPSS